VSDAPASAPAAPPPKAAAPRSARRRAREFALQGLYEWQLSHADVATVDAHVREFDDFRKCDSAYYDALLRGCVERRVELDAVLARHIDRPITQLSPVEHGVLLIGAYELAHCLEVPYRVAINEAVEVAKAFGGTDGHKYVNGVLDKAAAELRPAEARDAKRKPRR
jgi:transcription antitermination protein NusB